MSSHAQNLSEVKWSEPAALRLQLVSGELVLFHCCGFWQHACVRGAQVRWVVLSIELLYVRHRLALDHARVCAFRDHAVNGQALYGANKHKILMNEVFHIQRN